MSLELMDKVAEDFRTYYNEVVKKHKDSAELIKASGVLETALAFENIYQKHLLKEITNDTTKLNNLLDTSNPRPECGRTEDWEDSLRL